MNIFWHSAAPFANTGYGTQSAQVTSRLKAAGHNVGICAYYGLKGSRMDWNGMPIYPGDVSGYGGVMLPHFLNHFTQSDPDSALVITLQDVWTLNQHYEKLRPLRVASWVPVDCKPLSPRVAQYFELTGARPVAMSRFGETELRNAGFDPLFVPHAIDTSAFKPSSNRAKIRREVMGVPEDAFVVGMVAYNAGTNPPRKAFPQVFEAFKHFHEHHPEAVLYLHTDVFGMDDGINLMALKDQVVGIPDEAFSMTPQVALYLGIGAELLAEIYGGMDVLVNPSYGEGFGIPIVEAQACGVSVITSNWTSMPELTCNGWAISGEPFYVPQYGAYWLSPSIVQIYEAMEAAYEQRETQPKRDMGIEFASGYDADLVFEEHWKPVLEQLDRPREVAPLNRAERRRRARVAA